MKSKRSIDGDEGGDISGGGGGEEQKWRKPGHRISLTPRHKHWRKREQIDAAVGVKLNLWVGLRNAVLVEAVNVIDVIVGSGGVFEGVGDVVTVAAVHVF